MANAKTVPVMTHKMPSDLWERAKRYSDEKGMKRSGVVIVALREYLDRNGAK